MDVVSERAYNEVVDAAKLIWQEPVDTFADLATTYPNAEEGWTVMSREVIDEVNSVYRYNGSEWKEIQQILADAVNEVDHRLSTQLAQKTEIVVTETDIPVSSRKSGSFYLIVTDSAPTPSSQNITVSPTMGLKKVEE
ncbi:MAG: hypothetical protein ABS949_11040 [Solibacillus sp.]